MMQSLLFCLHAARQSYKNNVRTKFSWHQLGEENDD